MTHACILITVMSYLLYITHTIHTHMRFLPGYHQSTGQWLSLETDAAQLVGIALAFITGVRFMVPVRMGAALALVPTIQRWMESKQQSR